MRRTGLIWFSGLLALIGPSAAAIAAGGQGRKKAKMIRFLVLAVGSRDPGRRLNLKLLGLTSNLIVKTLIVSACSQLDR